MSHVTPLGGVVVPPQVQPPTAPPICWQLRRYLAIDTLLLHWREAGPGPGGPPAHHPAPHVWRPLRSRQTTAVCGPHTRPGSRSPPASPPPAAACGARARAAARGSPVRASPSAAPAAARSRRAAARPWPWLSRGVPPVAPAAAAPRGPPLRRGRVRVPAACARRALGHRAGGRAARPPRRCGPPCGGGGPLPRSVPGLAPPAPRGPPLAPPLRAAPLSRWAAAAASLRGAAVGAAAPPPLFRRRPPPWGLSDQMGPRQGLTQVAKWPPLTVTHWPDSM